MLREGGDSHLSEPPIPSTDAYPLHANARGEAADAADVETAFQRSGIG